MEGGQQRDLGGKIYTYSEKLQGSDLLTVRLM